jgi:glutaredoxin-like YruB-family protein
MPQKVTVYGTQICPWCHRTREFLKEHRVKFKDVDVGKSVKAAQEMIKKSGQQGVPVIDINGKIIIGYDEHQLKKLLKTK